MQINYHFVPMVQSFISKNMPHGGYNIVFSRLKNKITDVDSIKIKSEVSYLKPKSEPNHLILLEACKFLKENNILLDKYCEEYLEKEKESLSSLPK